MHGDSTALTLERVSKTFVGVRVLDHVSFTVKSGEIHGLLGANGAGKSTLVKILSGFHSPDAKSVIQVWGKTMPLPINRPIREGLAIVHQDLALVENLTVLENLGVTDRFGGRGLRPVSWRAMRSRARRLLQDFGVDASLDAPISSVDPSVKASVAILRSLDAARKAGAARVLFILDEPTVYFGVAQRDRLFEVMRRMVENGDSVLFISHRLAEVLEVCDRVSVLRDGVLVATREAMNTTEGELVEDMLGFAIGDFYPSRNSHNIKSASLSLDGVSTTHLNNLNLQLYEGEILGVTGDAGAGHYELPAVLNGLIPLVSGEMKIQSNGVSRRLNPRRATLAGIVTVPANRHRDGLWLGGTVGENLTFGSLRRFSIHGTLRWRAVRRASETMLSHFHVVPPEIDRSVSTLSGGNQQKVVLARALASNPKVLVLHEATQGVDARGKKEILELIKSTAATGVGVLMCSSDNAELAHVCNRVAVLRDGTVANTLVGDEITEEALFVACHMSVGSDDQGGSGLSEVEKSRTTMSGSSEGTGVL